MNEDIDETINPELPLKTQIKEMSNSLIDSVDQELNDRIWILF